MPHVVATAEKRKHGRTGKKIQLKVSLEERNGVPEWTIATSKNISASGILFGYNRRLERGTPLYLRIHFPDQAIDCTATVRRTVPGAIEPLSDVAVTMKGLEKKDRELLVSHIT